MNWYEAEEESVNCELKVMNANQSIHTSHKRLLGPTYV